MSTFFLQFQGSASLLSRLISNTANAWSIAGKIGSYSTNTAVSDKYFIDIVSFHVYAAWLPGFDASTYASVLNGNFTTLENAITSSGRSISNLKIAITEFNFKDFLPYTNRASLLATEIGATEKDIDPDNPNDPAVAGSNSFLAGQFLAEIACNILLRNSVKFVNFWSAREGDPAEAPKRDVGFFHWSTERSKPNYWHYKAIRDYFSTGNIYRGTLPNNTSSTKLTAFASKDSRGLAVMVINEGTTTPTYSINFKNTNSGNVQPILFNGRLS